MNFQEIKKILRRVTVVLACAVPIGIPASHASAQGDFSLMFDGRDFRMTFVNSSVTSSVTSPAAASFNEIAPSVVSAQTQLPWYNNKSLAEKFGNALVAFAASSPMFTSLPQDFAYWFVTDDAAGNTANGVVVRESVIASGSQLTSNAIVQSRRANVGLDQTQSTLGGVTYDNVFLTAVEVPEIDGAVLAQIAFITGGGYIAMTRRRKRKLDAAA